MRVVSSGINNRSEESYNCWRLKVYKAVVIIKQIGALREFAFEYVHDKVQQDLHLIHIMMVQCKKNPE